jgi:hypothetical protein
MRKAFFVAGLLALLVTAAAAQAVTLPAATAAGQPVNWTNTCASGLTCTFNVYRIAGSCPATPAGSAGWTLLTSSPIAATTFTDTGAAGGVEYCYAVEAVSGAANSAPVTAATTVPLLPTAPTGLAF